MSLVTLLRHVACCVPTLCTNNPLESVHVRLQGNMVQNRVSTNTQRNKTGYSGPYVISCCKGKQSRSRPPNASPSVAQVAERKRLEVRYDQLVRAIGTAELHHSDALYERMMTAENLQAVEAEVCVCGARSGTGRRLGCLGTRGERRGSETGIPHPPSTLRPVPANVHGPPPHHCRPGVLHSTTPAFGSTPPPPLQHCGIP